MHFPQHRQVDHVDERSHESIAVATRGASRQLFYRDRIPQLPSESRDYSRTNAPVVSTDSSDSSTTDQQPVQPQSPTQHHQQHNFAYDGNRLGVPGHVPQNLPPMHFHHRPAPSIGLECEGITHGRFIRGENGALVEVSEEVYAVRKAALTVLDPITYCWVSIVHIMCPAIISSQLVSHLTLSTP